MLRWMTIVALAHALVACRTVERFDVSDEPCALAEEFEICPACLTGRATCSYDSTTVSTDSCRTCAAERLLYQTLCDDGVDRIEGEVVCRW